MRKFALVLFSATVVAFAGLALAQSPAYLINADVVRGAENPTGPTCVLTPVFKTGEQVVWRAELFDAETGEKLTPEQVEERGVTVTAVLEDGSEYDMEYGLHPREEPQIWLFVGAWTIPPVYPTGTLTYEIRVEDDAGNVQTWTPIGQDRPGGYSSLLTIERR